MATTKVSKGLIKDGAVTIEKLNNALVVTEAEGIVNNDNDITVPTSAAVKDYVDNSAVTDSNFVFIDVKNETGSTIPLGTGVMAAGTDGNSGHILIAPMIADGSVEAKYFIGVLEENLDNGELGRVVTQGEVNQINTNAFLDGDVLWCDPANPGGFTKTEPFAPNVKISTAIVLNASTNGKIFVRVQGNEGLHELHDVGISSPINGQALVWDSTLGYWKNAGTVDGSGTANYVPKWTDGDTIGNSVIYDNGTNVGIGTTSPFTNLTVYGATDSRIALVNSNSGTTASDGFVMILENDSEVNFLNREIGDIKFATSGSERMRITSGGNVGIGTSGPSVKLHVQGSGEIFRIQSLSATGNPYMSFYQSGIRGALMQLINGGLLSIASEYDGIRFMTGTGGIEVERMRIDSAGNVGIGTDSPSSKLQSYVVTSVTIGSAANASLSLASDGAVNTHSTITFGKQPSDLLGLSESSICSIGSALFY